MDKLFKRVLACLIDMLLVSFVVSLLTSSSIINFQLEAYNKNYAEYLQIYQSYVEHNDNEINNCDDLKKAIDDEKLTLDTYVSQYDDLVAQKSAITEEEYDAKCSSIVESFNQDAMSEEEYLDKLNYYFPIIQKNSIMTYVIYIVICLSYFVFFQGFTNGQTLGKKITRLKVVTTDGKNLSYGKLFLRTILLYDLIYNFSMIFTWIIIPIKYYPLVINGIFIVGTILTYIISCMIVVTKDNRGLHDMLAHTRVVAVERSEKEIIDYNQKEKSEEVLSKKPKKVKKNEVKSK